MTVSVTAAGTFFAMLMFMLMLVFAFMGALMLVMVLALMVVVMSMVFVVMITSALVPMFMFMHKLRKLLLKRDVIFHCFKYLFAVQLVPGSSDKSGMVVVLTNEFYAGVELVL